MRSALDDLGVAYSYVDIRRDEQGRRRVREINSGCESVPTLVFPDGSTLTEPSIQALRKRLFQRHIEQEQRDLPGALGPRITEMVAGWLGVVLLLAGFALDMTWLMLLGAVLAAIWLGIKSRRA